jgi:DNA primase
MQQYNVQGEALGDEFVANCPFHDDHATPSFSLKLRGPSAGCWHCFSTHCQAKGNIVTFVARMEGWPIKKAIYELAHIIIDDSPVSKTNDELEQLTKKLKSLGDHPKAEHKRFDLPKHCSTNMVETFFTTPVEQGGRGYTKEGFKALQTDHIRYCTSGFYENRIIVPVFDDDTGDQIAFVARLFTEKRVADKYRYPKGWEKELHVATLRTGDDDLPSFICEGYFDGIHIQGTWNRCADVIFGSCLTATQAAQIAKRHKRTILALDGDLAGREGAYKAIPLLLQYGTEVSVLQLPEGRDPATTSYEEFINLPTISEGVYLQEWHTQETLKKLCVLGDRK